MSQETVKQLEEEGEVGADYLEELLDIADLGGDIDIDVDHGRASVAIIPGEDGDEQRYAERARERQQAFDASGAKDDGVKGAGGAANGKSGNKSGGSKKKKGSKGGNSAKK